MNYSIKLFMYIIFAVCMPGCSRVNGVGNQDSHLAGQDEVMVILDVDKKSNQIITMKNISSHNIIIDKNMIYGFRYSFPYEFAEGFEDSQIYPIAYDKLKKYSEFIILKPGISVSKKVGKDEILEISIFDYKEAQGLHFMINDYPPELYISRINVISDNFMISNVEYNPSDLHQRVFLKIIGQD